MFWYIVLFILLWATRFRKPNLSDEERFVMAVFYPLLLLGMAFIWNYWARNLIGWPEIHSFKEWVLTLVIF